MLDAGIDQLPKGARALMQTLAVAGRPINQEVAYQAAGLTGDELPLISSCARPSFCAAVVRNFGIELYHDRIRETLYAQLELPQVKQIHRRLAQTLEARGIDDPESLFEHYLGADERVRAASHAAAAAKKSGGGTRLRSRRQFLSTGSGARLRSAAAEADRTQNGRWPKVWSMPGDRHRLRRSFWSCRTLRPVREVWALSVAPPSNC